jgi:hypothetical protein
MHGPRDTETQSDLPTAKPEQEYPDSLTLFERGIDEILEKVMNQGEEECSPFSDTR